MWASLARFLPDPDAEKDAASTADRQYRQMSQSFRQSRAADLAGHRPRQCRKSRRRIGALGKPRKHGSLLAAEMINPTALNGSITTRWAVFTQGPGMADRFGDKAKAKEYFEKALAINPNGIDPNYFYADLLADQGEYAKAADI